MLRLFADEHLEAGITEGLRARGADILTVQEAGRRGRPDEAQLEFARRRGRVMLTRDTDFLRIHAQGFEHAGVLFAHAGLSVGGVVRGAMVAIEVLSAAEMENHLEFL